MNTRWYEQVCLDGLSDIARLIATVDALKVEIPRTQSNGYDMLALAISEENWKHNINALAAFLKELLPRLSDDTSGWGEDKVMLNSEWRLWVGGVKCFVLTFAPFYQPHHPRYSPTDSAYVVFQFESAFERNGVSTMSPETLGQLSQSVMANFENAGRWYFSEITHQSPEALRIIKPLFPGDPPVAWWSESSLQSDGGC
ncbi:MAG: hypothetical protein F6J86_25955 [Symploca sp. SIO1B1]|nr:hypothetical protein [Symploca sp. SIO1B1]